MTAAQVRQGLQRWVIGLVILGIAEVAAAGTEGPGSRSSSARPAAASGERAGNGIAGRPREDGALSAASRSSRASKLCALTTASQYGQAAAMPPTSGRYRSDWVRGLAHTTR